MTSIYYQRNGATHIGWFNLSLMWQDAGQEYTGTAIIFDKTGHIVVFTSDGSPFHGEDWADELRELIATEDVRKACETLKTAGNSFHAPSLNSRPSGDDFSFWDWIGLGKIFR